MVKIKPTNHISTHKNMTSKLVLNCTSMKICSQLYKTNYYITIIYKPCNIPPALSNNRLSIVIGGPVNNITI